MMNLPLSIQEDYWEKFSVNEGDIEFIYNLLLESAVPLSSKEIAYKLINYRIQEEKEKLQKNRDNQGRIYLPKDLYEVGETIIFPMSAMQEGKVISIRDGFNPDYPDLKVIQVDFGSGKIKSFASRIENHSLNQIHSISDKDENLNPQKVKEKYGGELVKRLEKALEKYDDLVSIAGNWFPRSLLVDVSLGYLNLAEAVLEEADGGPISTESLMKQVELTANVDEKLLAFSFDLSLQEDGRFDEVGPSGKTFWFLKRLEPKGVQETPIFLKYQPIDYSKEDIAPFIDMFEGNLYDELENWDSSKEKRSKITISLSFPHYCSGTLPLSPTLKSMFPTAYEAPRIRFTFVDTKANEKFPGWVVRPHNYIYGLKDWYTMHELMPGSLVMVEKGVNPGDINISYEKSRQNKEWLKTVLVGSDYGFVFAMLKHPINASFNERMAIAVPDVKAIEELWNQKIYEKEPLEKTILHVMRELAKLNSQGQVHAQELYAAVNVFRRCPPGIILYYLLNNKLVSHLGDLYFRINEKERD